MPLFIFGSLDEGRGTSLNLLGCAASATLRSVLLAVFFVQLELQKARSKELLKVAKQLGEELAAANKDSKVLVLDLPQLHGDGKALDVAAQVCCGGQHGGSGHL